MFPSYSVTYRHGRACPGHPRLVCSPKTWMPATSAGMTADFCGPRSKPPHVDVRGLAGWIEDAFDIHHQSAAVLEQTRDERPAGCSIVLVRDRKDDGVGG